jgi:glycerol kinase
MTADWILAIDQGTTNTKALVVGADGAILAQSAVPMTVTYPRAGWAEQSADAIWDSVCQAIRAALTGLDASRIAGLAISNQRESIVVWDAESGRPIAPCVIWQCRRSAERCAAIREAGHADEIERRTGLGLDPLFPAAKIAWILDDVSGARAKAEAGSLRTGTVDSWLIWKFTGGAVHATDYSNASRTQLFNTADLAWDADLANWFDVPLALLPEARLSNSAFGTVVDTACGLPVGVPIHAVMGDSHAALYGHGVRAPGAVKATYGTGSSLMTLTHQRLQSRHGLSGTIAWATESGVAHALEGNISVSGHAAAFAAQLLGLADAAALSELAQSVGSNEGVSFVPALVGLGAPYWQQDARGIIAGMSAGTRPAHVARAAFEAIALQIADVFRAMESDLGQPLKELFVDGGASKNDFLMQLQADILDRPVLRGDVAELSALGVATMAREALGLPMPAETQAPATVFRASISADRRLALLAQWADAIRRAR